MPDRKVNAANSLKPEFARLFAAGEKSGIILIEEIINVLPRKGYKKVLVWILGALEILNIKVMREDIPEITSANNIPGLGESEATKCKHRLPIEFCAFCAPPKDIKPRIKKLKNNPRPPQELEDDEDFSRDSYYLYLREISKFPLIKDRAEEIELAKLIHADEEAKEKFITANLRLVISTIRRLGFRGKTLEFLDFVQEGNIGLIKAVEKFNYRKGFKFSTYAPWWIRQSVSRALMEQDRIITYPVYLFLIAEQITRAAQELMDEKGREPTLLEISLKTDLTAQEIKRAQGLLGYANTLYLSDAVGQEDNLTLENLLPSFELSPEQRIELKEQLDKDLKIVIAICSILKEVVPPKKREIFLEKFSLRTDFEKRTLEDVGQEYNLSRERVRQIIKDCFKKLSLIEYAQKSFLIVIDHIKNISQLLDIEIKLDI